MKQLFILALLSSTILVACNGNTSNSTASKDSTNTTNQSSTTENTAATPPSTNNSSTSGYFKNVMDKMMSDMQGMQMSGDPDHDFAMMMKMHHQGAIDMSNVELSKGANAELKHEAQKIIDESQKDINDLNAFLGSHQPSKKSDFGQKQMDKMKSMNMNMDMGSDVDMQFAMMMSMHHQEGIDMAKDYLKVGTAEETKKVANNTIRANSEDLKKLKAHGGSSMDQSGGDMKGMNMKDMDMKDSTHH